MKVEYLLNGKINVTISEEDKLELETIKSDFCKILDAYILNERDDLDIELSTHLLNSHKLNELFNLRNSIICDLDYNKGYKNIIYIENGVVQFNENQLEFYHFANSYNILEDTTRAIRVLKNIVRVKLIEKMIEIDYSGNEMKVEFTSNKPYSKKHLEIFTPYGYELFCYLDRKWNIDKLPTKYSEIYHFMYKSYASNNFLIYCSGPKYIEFVKMHTNGFKFSKVMPQKIYNINEILNSFKDDYLKENNLNFR